MSANSTKKDRAWLLPDARNEFRPGLYLVATPIGNMGDMTLRGLDVLAAADLVVCEDTRVSGKLLARYGIEKPLLPYNDHNAVRQRAPILKKLQDGQCIAFISDAGTPMISDPGFKLVRECVEAGFYVTSIPGANAPLTALQLSALPSDRFCFIGFLPPKSAGRQKELTLWKNIAATLVAFESAPRLEASLADIKAVLGDRDVVVARELTKMYEEIKRASVSELIDYYREQGAPKGEIVLVIGAAPVQEANEDDVREQLKEYMKTMSKTEAAAQLVQEIGWSRKRLYDLALEIAKDDES